MSISYHCSTENLSEYLCKSTCSIYLSSTLAHRPPFCYSTNSEDLNTLVKRHIQTVVSLSPSKALSTLENDTTELIASGMVTLNAKFMNIEENKLLARVVDMWGFFWDQVLPYVEGVSGFFFCKSSEGSYHDRRPFFHYKQTPFSPPCTATPKHIAHPLRHAKPPAANRPYPTIPP